MGGRGGGNEYPSSTCVVISCVAGQRHCGQCRVSRIWGVAFSDWERNRGKARKRDRTAEIEIPFPD